MKDEEIGLLTILSSQAPAEIPHWFNAALPTDVPKLPYWGDEVASDEEKKILRQWTQDRSWDLEGRLRDFQKRFECASILREQHELANAEHRFFEWRMYYGFEMLKRIMNRRKS